MLLAIQLHAATKKKSQYQETISNNMWFKLYTAQCVAIKCKLYHNNTSTTKFFITGYLTLITCNTLQPASPSSGNKKYKIYGRLIHLISISRTYYCN